MAPSGKFIMMRLFGFFIAITVSLCGFLSEVSWASDETQKPGDARDVPPNIVVILLDDIGFGDASTFGGAAQTPELSKLAAQGLSYNNFNTTAICSSTRASLLTGKNHHHVGFGTLTFMAGNSPGYNAIWRSGAVSIAEVLRRNGYSTAAIGKWHNTPWKEINPTGPFDRWPTGLGFDYFYGFMEARGRDSQWEPFSLYRNTAPVEPREKPENGYHLTADLTNEAIHWIQTHDSLAAKKPYFLYFATGAVHHPHHVPKEWIEKYRGQFNQGWDSLREQILDRQKKSGVIPANTLLTARPEEIPAWTALSADQRKLYSHQMEVFAAYIEYTDYEVGRLLKAVQQGRRGDNTIIFYIVGDNGGGSSSGLDDEEWQLRHLEALGGPSVDNGVNVGWSLVSSTPFKWFKGVASHFGGVRNPLVISWPERIKVHGELRTQFAHVNDIAATIYEITGVTYPSEINGVVSQPLDGVSFAETFNKSDAPSKHRIQYFEMAGNRAIYEDGWVAAARHKSNNPDFEHDVWELYHIKEDFSESRDVASQYPDRLNALRLLFDIEAKKNDVYPLGGAKFSFPLSSEENTFNYLPGLPRLAGSIAPNFLKSHEISAHITVPKGGAQGVIVSYGGRWGGFVLYVKDNHVIYESSVEGDSRNVIRSEVPLPSGKVVLSYKFVRDSLYGSGGYTDAVSGFGQLYVNGQLVGEAKVKIAPLSFSWGSFGVGQAYGSPVSPAYKTPFKFNGTLENVRVKLEESQLAPG